MIDRFSCLLLRERRNMSNFFYILFLVLIVISCHVDAKAFSFSASFSNSKS